uniref:Uncharacterized protein n=1 Tax=Oryza punctata TaxID=4537 RepID=A0A0E0JDD9_ORYPU
MMGTWLVGTSSGFHGGRGLHGVVLIGDWQLRTCRCSLVAGICRDTLRRLRLFRSLAGAFLDYHRVFYPCELIQYKLMSMGVSLLRQDVDMEIPDKAGGRRPVQRLDRRHACVFQRLPGAHCMQRT